MLHIILLILKAVGILLAAVLLLLLLCILLLLFVPLRYEIAFRHTETETAVQGKVSWLLHLIRAKLFYEKPEEKGLLVKIGSFQLIPKKEKVMMYSFSGIQNQWNGYLRHSSLSRRKRQRSLFLLLPTGMHIAV